MPERQDRRLGEDVEPGPDGREGVPLEERVSHVDPADARVRLQRGVGAEEPEAERRRAASEARRGLERVPRDGLARYAGDVRPEAVPLRAVPPEDAPDLLGRRVAGEERHVAAAP